MKNVLWITILFLFVLGCSKDDNSSPRLLGTWERSYEPVAAEIEGLNEGDYLIVSQINFSSNNTYTSLLFIIDKNNQEKLGYFSKEIGTYNVDNNMIRLKYNSWASNEENYFESVPLENLILIKSDIEHSRSFYFENNELLLGCGELQNCALIPYKRVILK
ncbi:hypothetical protein SAMN04487764_1835 [Gillisia sp. Hel1_33_143]|uniref:hypothetical protein n=1 Tax=Gillisia sp. Hel1_33_143 TaxID=1336796 RepID=UPI00087AC4CD|nr:hypothetical protein [Gillisia sp. Hel1_33_143]SDS27202.1 hypothetical protein SAMN04487764_1835 [Gillisia sp. Hel1_33_143]